MPKLRIILAEDHELVAEGIRRIVEPEFEVLETVGNGLELVERCDELRPDVALTDVSMPKLNGLDALKEIKRKHPRTSVVVLTGSADVHTATHAFQAGASGYVLKHAAATELLTALREVQEGRTFITPRIAQDVLHRLMQPDSGQSAEPELTSRERQVLQLIAEGNSSKEAAAALSITPRTVEFHKRNVMKKTGLGSAAELARYAVKIGIVADG